MIRINLLRDHGHPVSQGEKLLVAKMLENAYRMGYETGYATATRRPFAHCLKAELFGFRARLRQWREKK